MYTAVPGSRRTAGLSPEIGLRTGAGLITGTGGLSLPIESLSSFEAICLAHPSAVTGRSRRMSSTLGSATGVLVGKTACFGVSPASKADLTA